MKRTPNSISDLFSFWPTIAEFSSDVGCSYEAARQMRRRGKIAPEHWERLVRAAKKRGAVGVNFEWLARQRLMATELAA